MATRPKREGSEAGAAPAKRHKGEVEAANDWGQASAPSSDSDTQTSEERAEARKPEPRRVFLCPQMVEVHVSDNSTHHAEMTPLSVHPKAFSADFHLEDEFQPLPKDLPTLEEGSEAYQISEKIINTAAALVAAVGKEVKDVPDTLWTGSLLHTLLGLKADDVREIDRQITVVLRAAAIELRAQGTVVQAHAPVKIFGDIHGQLRDLLLAFREFGGPFNCTGDIEFCQYIFNGDWVDRGSHQMETVLLLMALKARYPKSIWLVRGNHESIEMNKAMSARGHRGFDEDIAAKVSKESGFANDIFLKTHQSFSYLPMACVVDGAIVVLHGGIGDGRWSLDELASVPRPIRDVDVAQSNLLTQVLWSDPDEAGDKPNARGVHENPRGSSILAFGPDITMDFCERNRVRMIVRSHEYVPEGFRWAHGGRLLTVFTARDYDYDPETNTAEQNDGAILFVTRQGSDDSGGSDNNFSLKVTAKVLHRRGF